MATKKKIISSGKTKADLEMIIGKENLLIEKEKRYQRKIKGPQVEKQTQLKEIKKKPAPKLIVKKKK